MGCHGWSRGTIFLGLSAAASLAPQPTARAWTEAHIHSVRQHIECAPPGSSSRSSVPVHMLIGVQVIRGWLTGFTVGELPAGTRVNTNKPPWAVHQTTGHKYRLHVQPRGRDLHISFPGGKQAPTKGHVEVALLLDTPLSTCDPLASSAAWTMAPWDSGLVEPQIAISFPGTRDTVVADEIMRNRDGTTIRIGRHDGFTVFRFRREHLPRRTPWQVSITPQGPASGLNELTAQPNPNRTGPPMNRSWASWLLATWGAIGLFVVLLLLGLGGTLQELGVTVLLCGLAIAFGGRKPLVMAGLLATLGTVVALMYRRRRALNPWMNLAGAAITAALHAGASLWLCTRLGHPVDHAWPLSIAVLTPWFVSTQSPWHRFAERAKDLTPRGCAGAVKSRSPT